MYGEGDFIQIALEFKAGLLHEVAIFGRPCCRFLAEICEGPQRLQIGVQHAIAFGKQARRLGRRAHAQKHCRGKQSQHRDHGEGDREDASAPRACHGMKFRESGTAARREKVGWNRVSKVASACR